MKTVSVSDLKAHLSRYLRMVRRGSEVQVSDRGVPIARLVGLREASTGDLDDSDQDGHDHEINLRINKARLDRLVKGGVLRRGSGDLSWILRDAAISLPTAQLSRSLEEERGDRV